MNRWQKSIPLLSKIHFVRSLMIDDEMMVGRVFFVSKENSIRGMDGALRYCRCGFCKRIARNRSLALCVFPSRFPLLFLSLPLPLSVTWFHLVLSSPLVLSSLLFLLFLVGTTRERPRAKSSEWNRRNLKNILNLITPASLGLSKSSGLPMAGWKIADRRTVRRTSSGVAFGFGVEKKGGRREKRVCASLSGPRSRL